MGTPAVVKVLKGLPLAIVSAGERHLLKAFETLFVIKAMYPRKPMPMHTADMRNASIQQVASYSQRSTKTIKRRLITLLNEGLLQRVATGLVPISWDKLRERYKIQHEHFYHIKQVENVQLEYMLKAKVFQDKEQHCRLGFIAQREGNRIRKEVLKQVSNSLDCESVAMHQLECFHSEGKRYDDDEAYALNTYYHRKDDKVLRGDLAINYFTIHKMFGYKSYGGVAKLKRYLEGKGVISVRKRKETLTKHTHTTNASRITRLGFVKWNKEQRIVELIMPDLIAVTATANVSTLHLQRQKVLQAATEARPLA